MSKPLNPTATRAREVALRRHRREVMVWQWISIGLATILLVFAVKVVLLEHTLQTPQVWRTDAAPVGEPYWVVTQAYVRKKDRVWCSFDTGEPLSVSHWTTQQP
jgi:hypothetical protein